MRKAIGLLTRVSAVLVVVSMQGASVAGATECRTAFAAEGPASEITSYLVDGQVVVLIDHATASHKVLSRAKVRREFVERNQAKVEVTADSGGMKTFSKDFVYRPAIERHVRARIQDLSATLRADELQPDVKIVALRQLPSTTPGVASPIQYVGLLPDGKLVHILEVIGEIE